MVLILLLWGWQRWILHRLLAEVAEATRKAEIERVESCGLDKGTRLKLLELRQAGNGVCVCGGGGGGGGVWCEVCVCGGWWVGVGVWGGGSSCFFGVLGLPLFEVPNYVAVKCRFL